MTITDENDPGNQSPNLVDILGKIGTVVILKVKNCNLQPSIWFLYMRKLSVAFIVKQNVKK